MKKLLLAVPLVAGASWAGASYYTGTQTQSSYDQLLVHLNELKPLTLVNEEYNAGLAHSTAITRVLDSNAADARVLFRLHHDIQHSPVGLNDNGSVRVGAASIRTTLIEDSHLPQQLRELLADFTDREPVRIDSAIGFDGTSSHQFLISAYQQQHDEVNIRFDGIDVSAVINGDHLTASGTIGEFQMTGDEGVLNMTPGQVNADLKRISQAIHTGTYDIGFDSMSISSDNLPDDISLQDLSLSSNTQLENERFDSRLTMAVGRLNTPLPLETASLEASVTGLPFDVLQSAVNELSAVSLMEQMAPSDPQSMQRLLDAYKSMIAPGAALAYDIKLGTTMGDAQANYSLSVLDASSPNYPVDGVDSVHTPRDLLNMLRAEMHIKADAAVVDQTPLAMFLASPQAQQMVVSDGISYSSDIVVSDLIVDINGNPMSLEIMAGEMLDVPFETLMSM